jgi:hypothetical protein
MKKEQTYSIQKIANSISKNIESVANTAANLTDSVKEATSDIFTNKELYKEVNIAHYFCLPDPKNIGSYIIVTKREVSEGVHPDSMPSKRIFHAHNEDVIETIRQSMIEMDRKKSLEKYQKDAYSGDSLLNIANHIDKANENISTTVLLAGAATCIINPVLGVAIMGKTLIPSIGAKVASEVLQGSGNSINKWSKDRTEEKAQKEVTENFKKAEPIIEPNIVLYKINTGLNNRDYNPMLETIDNEHDVKMLSSALKEVYGDYLGNGFFDKSNLSNYMKKYISHLLNNY